MRLSKRFVGTTVAGALAVALMAPAGASAVDIDPTTTADEFNSNPAACSLREAVEAASTDSSTNADGCPAGSGKDVIHLRAGANYELTIPGFDGANAVGDIDVRGGDLVITAPQVGGATIDGNGTATGERAIEVINAAPAIDVVIDNINVVDGGGTGPAADNGGAIAVNGFTNAHKVTLIDMSISGSRAILGGALSSGVQSTVVLQDVTITGNSATVDGGAMNNEGATTLLNSTVTGNQANSDGDFIGAGGGLYQDNGSLLLKNTILAGNADAGQGAKEPECDGGPVTSLGNNLVGSLDGCNYVAGPNDQVGVIALGLLPLTQNGGPAKTIALAKKSPAVDKGAGCTANDSRDLPRSGRCDIGAYERATCGDFGPKKPRLINVIGTAGPDDLHGVHGGVADGIVGLGGNDTVKGLGAGDCILGGAGKDRLFGGDGKDQLFGGAGKDRLKGNRANDRLAGGKGKDKCVGGPGRKDRIKSCEKGKA